MRGFSSQICSHLQSNILNDTYRLVNSEPERDSKKKLAFLDLLIDAHNNNELTIDDIIEEVDTFMFEGHDTVATNIAFCLYLLSTHEEERTKVQAAIHLMLVTVTIRAANKPSRSFTITYREGPFRISDTFQTLSLMLVCVFNQEKALVGPSTQSW